MTLSRRPERDVPYPATPLARSRCERLARRGAGVPAVAAVLALSVLFVPALAVVAGVAAGLAAVDRWG
jgi:hypothetical protein